jgi:hypothetical protein
MLRPEEVKGQAHFLKRGHNRDFALTKIQMENVIQSTTSQKTKAILILIRQGYAVREVVDFTGKDDPRLVGISPVYMNYLVQYAGGFGISSVAVWRRVKKALIHAVELGAIELDMDKIPFPEALRTMREEPPIEERLKTFAWRVHVLNGGPLDLRDPSNNCPHGDCIELRDIIRMVHQETLRRT